jgi:hypothetical protein
MVARFWGRRYESISLREKYGDEDDLISLPSQWSLSSYESLPDWLASFKDGSGMMTRLISFDRNTTWKSRQRTRTTMDESWQPVRLRAGTLFHHLWFWKAGVFFSDISFSNGCLYEDGRFPRDPLSLVTSFKTRYPPLRTGLW